MGMPMTNAQMVSLNPATNYNANYLQQKPDTILKDPKLTYWTPENALQELKTSAGELPGEQTPKTSLLEKLQFIAENTEGKEQLYYEDALARFKQLSIIAES